MVLRIALLSMTACGRLGFDPLAPQDGTGPGDGGLLGPPLMAVDPSTLGPFGPATLVAELSLPGIEEDDPSLTRDQLEIFFDRGENDLFTSRRASIGDPWPTPVPIAELNTPATEEHPHVSADGLRLYFTSGRAGNPDLYVTRRADRDSPWEEPTPIAELNTGEDEETGGIDAAERFMVFSSNRGGLANDDLYEAHYDAASSTWVRQTKIAGLEGPQIDTGAHLDDFGLVMHHQRAQTIVWRQRSSPDDAWSEHTSLSELDDMSDVETDPWLSPDLRTIYFARNTPGLATVKDIYMATR